MAWDDGAGAASDEVVIDWDHHCGNVLPPGRCEPRTSWGCCGTMCSAVFHPNGPAFNTTPLKIHFEEYPKQQQ